MKNINCNGLLANSPLLLNVMLAKHVLQINSNKNLNGKEIN